MGLSDYEGLKSRLLLATALLTAGGSGIAAVTVGPDAAVPFAVGGLAGLLYQLLLQLGADAAVAQAAATSPGSFDAARSSGSGVSAAVTSFSAAAARSRGARVPAGTMAPQFMAEPVSQEGFQGRMLRVLGSAPFRLLLLSTAALLGIWLVQENTMGTCWGRSWEGGSFLSCQYISHTACWGVGGGSQGGHVIVPGDMSCQHPRRQAQSQIASA